MYSPRGQKGAGVIEWWMQRISAIVLLGAVIFHFLYMHLVTTTNPGDLNFDKVATRLQNPVWLVFDIILISACIWHGVFGLKIVIDDWVRHRLGRAIGLSIAYVFMFSLWAIGMVAILKVGLGGTAGATPIHVEMDMGGAADYNAGNPATGEEVDIPDAGTPPPQENPDWYPEGEGGQ